MAEHSPLVSSLKISILKISLINNEEVIVVVNGGIFSVTGKEITILTTNFCMEDEVEIDKITDELRNIEYQIQSDIKEAEAKSLDKRYQYALMKQNLYNIDG